VQPGSAHQAGHPLAAVPAPLATQLRMVGLPRFDGQGWWLVRLLA
jgi:hypothetical protein